MAVALAMLALAGVAALGPAQEKGDGWVQLFNGKDFTGWRKFVDPRSKADPDMVWTVRDGIIVCTGRPNGYLITDKEYGDFVLRVQWRWSQTGPARGRNSGVFVWVTGPDKIWPKGVEAQLFSGSAGDIWLVDNFKLRVDRERQDPKTARHFYRLDKDNKEIEKPIGEWNQYEITCKGGTIKLVVNGRPENEGTMAERSTGKILLQSEGSEIHFRNVELKHLAK
jgi:hypothetical protein